ncbi:MAG TPA: RNA polymerase sigma factor [Burkholderiaceae bacterium]|nr:RNA polymerase sigma factor [Burkholderiaceae bacterium]
MTTELSAELLAAQIPRLRRYARALTGSRAAADDLTQDTLERAWNKRALWRAEAGVEGGNLRGWLFAVMHNVFINGIKRARPTESLDDAETAAAEPSAPAASVETGVRLQELHTALQRLADGQREVVLLVGLEQLSYAEAAQALGVPIGTVMSRLSRGRERLRQLLEEGGSGPVGLRRVK